jgi:hypothetical protein
MEELKETHEERITRLERIAHSYLELMEQLATVSAGHQGAIEALAAAVGVKLERQPAAIAPLSTKNQEASEWIRRISSSN